MPEELNTHGRFLEFLIGALRGLGSDEPHLVDRLRVRLPLDLRDYIREADTSESERENLRELTEWLQANLSADTSPASPPPAVLVRSVK